MTDDVDSTVAALLERGLVPGLRGAVGAELAALGDAAIPALVRFFAGQIANAFGVPYRRFGELIPCVLAAVRRLGPRADPLEASLAAELGHPNARIATDVAGALRALSRIDDATIGALAACLSGDLELAAEATATLRHHGQLAHPVVAAARARSPRR